MFTSHCLKNRIGSALAFMLALTFPLYWVPALAHRSIRLIEARDQIITARAPESARPPESHSEPPAPVRAQVAEAYGQLGLSFEANHGQTNSRVNFITRASGTTVYLTPTEAVMVLSAPADESDTSSPRSLTFEEASEAPPLRKKLALRMKIEGSNPTAEVHGQDELPGKVNYLIGSDPAKWHTNIPTFARVEYANVYPGVDLVYYGNQRQLEYDFRLAPGADAGQVAITFEGAEALEVDAGGDLLIRTKLGTVRQLKPVVYQEVGGERREVPSSYALRGQGKVGFNIGGYDATRPLIIDPVLAYSTFLGGSNADQGFSIAVDSAGNAYVTGVTSSDNFPTTDAFDNLNGGRDAFVTKLNAAGSGLIYSTYLGGSGDEMGRSIAVDSAGSAYLTGSTDSTNFPRANPIQSTYGGGVSDAFVTKLNGGGSALLYSTYLGGISSEEGVGIAVDLAKNAYLTGPTRSVNFPTINAGDNLLSGTSDAFVTMLNAGGSALAYSTYLGGSNNESGTGIAVNRDGQAYVTGLTNSTNFPTTPNAIQPTYGGGVNDAFVAKLFGDGVGGPIYSTYLGGSERDDGKAIALDSAGNVYVTGNTSSTDFPIAHALDDMLSGSNDAFVTKLNTTGSPVVYSTYLGGGGFDNGNGIKVDSAGNAYVTGATTSSDFPTANPIQSAFGGGFADAFVTELNAAGSALVYSTYLGGSDQDAGTDIAVDSAGNAYITGSTFSPDFPTSPNPAQEVFAPTNADGFVAKIGEFSISGRVIDAAGHSLAGVTLTMSGSSSGVTQTDANGYFALLNTFLNGTYTVTPAKDGFDFTPTSNTIGALTANREIIFVGSSNGSPTPTPTPATFQFSAASLSVSEDAGQIQVTVTRSGGTSSAVAVDYATTDGTANDRGDYATAIGRLRFGVGETARSFNVYVTDDTFVEGNETLQITLSNPNGGALAGAPNPVTLTIVDNDLTSAANPIDSTVFFVRQHYVDFLGRAPDPGGLAFWVQNIESCGADAQCRELKLVDTSAAFFLSIEFQESGFLVHRAERVAFNRFPLFREFIRDTHELGRDVVVGQAGWQAQLDANKQSYFNELVARVEFTAIYAGLTNQQYVDALNANTSASLSASERNALVAALNNMTETRARVLQIVSEDVDFAASEKNSAFVLAQYFGYLRRNPSDAPDADFSGFNFWLAKLNSFGGDFRRAEMVKSFLSSTEYRRRFGQP